MVNKFKFQEVENMIDNNVFRDISYGLYIVSTKYNNKNVGCVINTLSQVTSENPIISFSINKNNYTNEAIKSSKKLAISIISEETKEDIIFKFGYNSSRDIDKFENCDFIIENEMPVVTDGMCGYLICDLVQTVDCGTHDIFIGRVTNTKKLSNNKEMTYRYYHEVIKAVAPKNAPTYIDAEQNKAKYAENSNNETTNSNMKYEKYKCIICGYIYDESIEKIKFTDLPDDWKCPRCGVGKENFVKID